MGASAWNVCAVICHISPMALYRLICALGQQSLVTALTRCGLPLPIYFLADEKHSYCLTEKVYLPTIVSYQRRAQHAGQCGVEVEGGRVSTKTGTSICRSSPQEASDERLQTPTTKLGGM